MVLALWPNINVDLVSVSLKDAGEQQIMIVVLALPPVKYAVVNWGDKKMESRDSGGWKKTNGIKVQMAQGQKDTRHRDEEMESRDRGE